jgi:hypothetical protein
VRVVDRTVEDSVEFEKTTVLVEFVFALAIGRYLDDSIDKFRSILSESHMVPRVLGETLKVSDLGVHPWIC